jgi:hypothetical protein
VIHFAAALAILSLTCAALTLLSYVSPITDAGVVFASGSLVATVFSMTFAAYVWRSGL